MLSMMASLARKGFIGHAYLWGEHFIEQQCHKRTPLVMTLLHVEHIGGLDIFQQHGTMSSKDSWTTLVILGGTPQRATV